jgi:hypothetical protein
MMGDDTRLNLEICNWIAKGAPSLLRLIIKECFSRNPEIYMNNPNIPKQFQKDTPETAIDGSWHSMLPQGFGEA